MINNEKCGCDTNGQQKEIDSFKSNFSKFKDQKIVLYGIGRHTATLVPAIGEFHIVGLMDRDADNIGKHMYGIPIISAAEAEKKADIVIINAAETYWEIIYKRISGITIPVYYPNGENAAERVRDSSLYQQNPYWQHTLGELQQKITQYEVISFDIFDTLVMRKVFMPQDIFKLVEKRIRLQMGLEIDFYRVRLETDQLSGDRYMLLDDIYAEMNLKWNLQEDVLESIKQIEIETEVESCVPRQDIAGLFNEIAVEKETYLVSDMYLPSEVIVRILRKCGIYAPHDLWISGEKKKNKKSGELWACFSQNIVKGRTALHIGDNLSSDVKIPLKYGIDTYYVMNSTMMWEKSSLCEFVPEIQTLEQSIFAGLLGSKIFNSPFALSESKGIIRFSDFGVLGYCLWGGIIYSFLMWMVKEAKSRKINRLFFFARDGYLLIKDYDYLKTIQKNAMWPSAIYLATSRRMTLVSTFERDEDLEQVIGASYNGTFSQYMYDRFDISVAQEDRNAENIVCMPGDADRVREWILPYEKQIISQICWERDNYLAYVSQYNIGERDGVIDLWFNGRNQYFLSKVVGRCLTGFYFTANLAQENECCKDNVLVPCFQAADDIRAEQSNIMRRDIFVESFLTAPYGMIKYLDEKFSILCAPDGSNQKFFEERNIINQGVCDFMRDYVELMGEGAELEPKFVDRFFGEYVNEHMELSSELKDVFYYDNAFVHRGESKIFD